LTPNLAASQSRGAKQWLADAKGSEKFVRSKNRSRFHFLSGLLQNRRGKLDIVQDIKHAVVDRHAVPGWVRFLSSFLTSIAMKNGLQNGSRLRARVIQQGNPVSVILNDSTTGVATYLRAGVARVIYLKYKRHDKRLLAGSSLCKQFVSMLSVHFSTCNSKFRFNTLGFNRN